MLAVVVVRTAHLVHQAQVALVVVEGQIQLQQQTMPKMEKMEKVAAVAHRDLELQALEVVVL
jgi:hypothetical protein